MLVEICLSFVVYDIFSFFVILKNFGWLILIGQYVCVLSFFSLDFVRVGGYQCDLFMFFFYILFLVRYWLVMEVIFQSLSFVYFLIFFRLLKLMQQNQNGNVFLCFKGLKEKFDKLFEKFFGKVWRNLLWLIFFLFLGKKSDGVGSILRGIGRDFGVLFQGSR